jgi:ABC-2 type transport system ATP-binding protein
VHWLRGFLRQFAQAGRTVLISSHVLAEVAQTVDSVLILNAGRLVAERRIDELPEPARALEAVYLELTTPEGS